MNILSLFCSCLAVLSMPRTSLLLRLKKTQNKTKKTTRAEHFLSSFDSTDMSSRNMNTKNLLAWPLNCCTDTPLNQEWERKGNLSVSWTEVIYNTVLLNWLLIILYTGIVFVNKPVWIFSLVCWRSRFSCVCPGYEHNAVSLILYVIIMIHLPQIRIWPSLKDKTSSFCGGQRWNKTLNGHFRPVNLWFVSSN